MTIYRSWKKKNVKYQNFLLYIFFSKKVPAMELAIGVAGSRRESVDPLCPAGFSIYGAIKQPRLFLVGVNFIPGCAIPWADSPPPPHQYLHHRSLPRLFPMRRFNELPIPFLFYSRNREIDEKRRVSRELMNLPADHFISSLFISLFLSLSRSKLVKFSVHSPFPRPVIDESIRRRDSNRLIINSFSTTRSNVEGEKMRESEREDFRYGQSILIY